MTEYSYTGAHGRDLVAGIAPETTYQPGAIGGCIGFGGAIFPQQGEHQHLFNSRETFPGPESGMKTVIDACPCKSTIRLTVCKNVDVPIPLRDGSYPGLTELTSSFSWERRY